MNVDKLLIHTLAELHSTFQRMVVGYVIGRCVLLDNRNTMIFVTVLLIYHLKLWQLVSSRARAPAQSRERRD